MGVQSIGKCIDLDHMIVYEDRKYNVDNPRKGSCVIVFMGIEFKQQQSFQVLYEEYGAIYDIALNLIAQ